MNVVVAVMLDAFLAAINKDTEEKEAEEQVSCLELPTTICGPSSLFVTMRAIPQRKSYVGKQAIWMHAVSSFAALLLQKIDC